jgi:hypothetical protein
MMNDVLKEVLYKLGVNKWQLMNMKIYLNLNLK